MVADVLGALAGVPALDAVVMVTAEPRAAALAHAAGATVLHDPDEVGQSTAAARGVEAASALFAERVLLVPGDCPALAPEEVDRLLAHTAARRSVVIVPDRHGHGTNALL